MSNDSSNAGFLNLVNDIASRAASGSVTQLKKTSLVDFTSPSRVEPIALVDRRVGQLPYADELMQSLLNIFAGYYLQAVVMITEVGRTNVIRMLEPLSTDRNPLSHLSTESRPTDIDPLQGWFSDQLPEEEMALEARRDSGEAPTADISESMRTLRESSDLSVGKLLEVTLKPGGEKQESIKVPVRIRLRSIGMKSDVLTHTLSLGLHYEGIKERFHRWRAGQLRFIKDIILAQDLIERHRKNLLDDESGQYFKRVKENRKHTISSVLSGKASVNAASSIFVMTSDTARELEGKIRGSLSRFQDREKLFVETSGMLMAVVDPDWEMVTIYHRHIEDPTEVSVRSIQRANSGGKNGPDITEVLNALRQSRSPSL